MSTSTSKDAIIAFLNTPTVAPYRLSASEVQEWFAQQRADGFTAKPETIRFIKERSLPHRQLHFVTFEQGDRKGLRTYSAPFYV